MLGPRSTSAHAGTLSFEMTVGDDPLIVNCGSGARFDPEWRLMGRATESHSTLGLEGYASARFGPAPRIAGTNARALVDGPAEVLVKAQETETGHGVTMSHDGWRRTHGLTHLRNLTLEDGGTLLRGEDALAAFTTADRTLLDGATGACRRHRPALRDPVPPAPGGARKPRSTWAGRRCRLRCPPERPGCSAIPARRSCR
jgi:uncharacterized heparinase superfamily protein